MKWVYAAFPLLIVLAVAEWALTRGRWHRRGDALANAGCGAVEQAFGKLVYPVLFVAYRALEARAPYTMPIDSPWTWVGCFVLADLTFYAFHRAAHRVPVIWATHCVHHASSEMNLTVAMRNGAFQRLFAVWFYLPLAVIGVPGDVLLVMLVVQVLYQFVLHTRYGGAFGPLGWILATPSHHRVHHGLDDAYVDRNYGAVLIVWDRLFGTFAAETHAPTYGVRDPSLRTDNPLIANVVGWRALLRQRRRSAPAPSAGSSATPRGETAA